MLRSSSASVGKELSKDNLRKRDKPCFHLFCRQPHELPGSSAPYGWDGNDPGDLLWSADGLERGLLDGVQGMFFQVAQAFSKDREGGKHLSIAGFQLHARSNFLQKKCLGGHIWQSQQETHPLRAEHCTAYGTEGGPVSKPE